MKIAKAVFIDRSSTNNITLQQPNYCISFAKNLKGLFFNLEEKRYSRQQTIGAL